MDSAVAPPGSLRSRGARRRRAAHDWPSAHVVSPARQRRDARKLAARTALIAAIVLALVDLLVDAQPLHLLTRVLTVVAMGGATLLAAAAAEPAGPDGARRWHLQALATGLLMLMLMAAAPTTLASDVLWFFLVVGAISTLVALATTYRYEAGSHIGAVCLILDAAIVGFTTLLTTLSVANGASGTASAALLLGGFAAAGYALAVATRPAMRTEPYGAQAMFLGGVVLMCLYAAGEAARHLQWGLPMVLATPGVTLVGGLAMARSAWLGARTATAPPQRPAESRLRLMPAVAAAAAILVLSWAELNGQGTRAGFFGIIVLFGLIVGRLLVTLIENRQLLQHVQRSGVLEANLRDLGGALVAAGERKDTLEMVCRTAQASLRADSVILWMLDPAANELEAVEVLSPRREWLMLRRLAMSDPSSLAVRVAHTGAAEIVHNVPNADQSNAYLNVLLHSQSLLAVPIVRGENVQGVLVCIDSRSPAAYGPPELARGELLASQVGVALDSAYQHALQRRRVDELSALYQFAQSAHAAQSSTAIVQLLLPIVKERLGYTFGTVWLREEGSGGLRAVAVDVPEGAPRSPRPSPLAQRAFATGEPARAGLDWGESDAALQPPHEPGGSQLAVPLVLKRRVVGVVDLEHSSRNAYSPIEEHLLVSLANHAALAIDNLHLLEESRKVEALRELDRMKTELLGTVSHELRTPLGSIKGYATTLLTHGNRLKRDEQREFLEIIDSEADRLRELIENLLDMSRIEAGVLRIDKSPTRLGELVRECVRKVQLSATAHTLQLDWPVENPLVLADSKRIYQVLQNLLTNAVKYSPDGGVIRVVATPQRHELLLSVHDQGLGMPAGELDKIFDRFHRVGGDVSRRIGGTGLGLAICKGLVDAHGGRIWAESGGEGQGSVFRFTLPLLNEAGDSALTKGADDHQKANRTRR